MAGPGDDPLDFARKLAESYRGIKFGRGVVGKSTYVVVANLTLWFAIVWRLSESMTLNLTLLTVGVVGTALSVWWINKTQKFATENPGQAILDGAQFIEYQKWEAEIKGQPTPTLPLVPDPQNEQPLIDVDRERE